MTLNLITKMFVDITFKWLVPSAIGCGLILILFLAVILIYKLLRPRFPVHVSCWFCGFDTIVPYGNQNCWDCPQCEQYNGFTQDGDYNKPIPAQHVEDLNHSIKCKSDKYIGCRSSLCLGCQQNQLLKVKQLAAFMPINEDMYECEVEAYERHLEQEYQLCADCRCSVERELHKQDDILRVSLQGTKFDTSAVSDMSETSQVEFTRVNCSVAVSRVLGFLAWLISSGLLASQDFSKIAPSLRGMSLIADNLSQFFGSHILVHSVTSLVAEYPLLLSIAGFSLCFVSKVFLGKRRLSFVDQLDCLTWLLYALGCVLSPRLVAASVLCIVTATNFVTSLASVLCPRLTKNMHFMRISLDQSDVTPDTESETLPVSSDVPAIPAPCLPSQNTEPVCDADDLDLEFNAMSVDPLGFHLKRNDSGVFSSTASLNSLASMTRSASSSEPRPVITPAKLTFINFQRPVHPPNGQFGRQQTMQLLNKDSQENLFQPSSQANNDLHLFNREYMQSIPALKPTPFTSTKFPNLSDEREHTQSSVPGSVFNRNLVSEESMFTRSLVSEESMFARNPISEAQEMPRLYSSQFNTNQNHCTSNRIIHQSKLFDTACKTTVSPSLWSSPVINNKSQFPSSINSNFSAKVNENFFSNCGSKVNDYSNYNSSHKVFCPTFADNPFSGVKKNKMSTSSMGLGSSGQTCAYDGVAKLRNSLNFDDISQSTESSPCAVDNTSVMDSAVKKGSVWTAVGIGCILGVSIVVNAGLTVYFFSTT